MCGFRLVNNIASFLNSAQKLSELKFCCLMFGTKRTRLLGGGRKRLLTDTIDLLTYLRMCRLTSLNGGFSVNELVDALKEYGSIDDSIVLYDPQVETRPPRRVGVKIVKLDDMMLSNWRKRYVEYLLFVLIAARNLFFWFRAAGKCILREATAKPQ